MAITEVTMWMTENGLIFYTKEEAEEHESMMVLGTALADCCDLELDQAIEIAKWLKRNFVIYNNSESVRELNPGLFHLQWGKTCQCDGVEDEKEFSILDMVQEEIELPNCSKCGYKFEMVSFFEQVG